MKKKIRKFAQKGKELEKETRHKVIGYIVAAFGLVAALAWNDAIKAFIGYLFPLNKNSIMVKFLYASLITVIVVIISMYLVKLVKKEEK